MTGVAVTNFGVEDVQTLSYEEKLSVEKCLVHGDNVC